MGPYISVENKQFYVGTDFLRKGPELIQINYPNPNVSSEKFFNSDIDIRDYNNVRRDIRNRLNTAEPIPVVKSAPTTKDYNRGHYTRYFTRRFNGESYIEIDQETYRKLENRSPQYDYNLYEWGNLVWYLKGNVYQKNAISVKQASRKFPRVFVLFPILNEFFINDLFFVQEDLLTDGGELYFSNGVEYKGLYHLHPTIGPMVGGKHSSGPHEKLYYTNQLPNIEGVTYDDFLANYNKIDCYKCINRFGKFKKVISSKRSALLGCPFGTTSNFETAQIACFGAEAASDNKMRLLENNVNNRLGPNYISTSSPDLKRVFPLDGGAPSFKDYSGFGLWNKNNKQYGEYNNENGSCFSPNTLVTMADGTEKMIAKIKKGDKVKSQVGESTVLEVLVHTGSFDVYSINESKPFVTEEHPFKTIDGWKAINPITTLEKHQIQSKTLDLEDILIKLNGREIIKSITKSKATYPNVYNLSLDNEHVYYANNYLVHNEKQIGLSIDDLEEMATVQVNFSAQSNIVSDGFNKNPTGINEVGSSKSSGGGGGGY